MHIMHSCVRGDEFILQEMENCILRAVARVGNMSAAAAAVRHGCVISQALTDGGSLRSVSVKAAVDQHEAAATGSVIEMHHTGIRVQKNQTIQV